MQGSRSKKPAPDSKIKKVCAHVAAERRARHCKNSSKDYDNCASSSGNPFVETRPDFGLGFGFDFVRQRDTISKWSAGCPYSLHRSLVNSGGLVHNRGVAILRFAVLMEILFGRLPFSLTRKSYVPVSSDLSRLVIFVASRA